MERKKKTKRSDFPNDWLFYKRLKSKHFKRVSFQDFWDERVLFWLLAPGTHLVARVEGLTTGHIKEHSFSSKKKVVEFFERVHASGLPCHVHCFDSQQSFTAVFND